MMNRHLEPRCEANKLRSLPAYRGASGDKLALERHSML